MIKNFCEEECGVVLEAGSVIVRVRRNEMCQDSRKFLMRNSSFYDRRIVEVDGMVVRPIMIGNNRTFSRCLHILICSFFFETGGSIVTSKKKNILNKYPPSFVFTCRENVYKNHLSHSPSVLCSSPIRVSLRVASSFGE